MQQILCLTTAAPPARAQCAPRAFEGEVGHNTGLSDPPRRARAREGGVLRARHC